MITLYGIKNCDTVRKARQWLEAHAIVYRFHDFRSDGLTRQQLQHILVQCDWKTVLNRRSATWKTLGNSISQPLDAQSASALMLEYPTLIKRPILDTGDEIIVGFDIAIYQSALQP